MNQTRNHPDQSLLEIATRVGRVGAWAVDLCTQKITWSDETRRIYEVDADYEPNTEDALSFLVPKDRQQVEKLYQDCIEFGMPFEGEFKTLTAKGKEVWIRAVGEAIFDERGQVIGVQGAIQDITDRKRAEVSLAQSEERLRLMAKATMDAIWDWDLVTNELWWSEGIKRLFGLDQMDIGVTIEDWARHIHPDERQRVTMSLEKAVAQGQEIWSEEYRFLCKDGSYAHVVDRGQLIFDENGKPIRMVGGLTDLTQRKNLEKQFLHVQRMESLGTLAGGIAHDLNNVLSPIILSIDLLKSKISDQETLEIIERILKSAQRGSEMVKQVLSFARGVEGQKVEVNLKHIVHELMNIVRETFPKNIRIVDEMDEDVGGLIVDPTQLHQVFLNLCLNAKDAMPGGGTITISAKNIELNNLEDLEETEGHLGSYIRIEVKDEGEGVEEDLLEKIFDPFFTTKDVGKGTGLGLSTSMAIVKSHQGFMRAVNLDGGGTCISVDFPVVVDGKDDALGPGKNLVVDGRGKTILVIDDEEAIREMLRRSLEENGYQVILAKNGEEGLNIFKQEQDNIDVVFTDMMMPVMDGSETVKAIRQIDKKVSILAASGFIEDQKVEDLLRNECQAFLAKPYSVGALLDALQAALNHN